MYILTVDNREQKVIEDLSSLNIKFSKENLDVGDFRISDEEGKTVIVLERKTYSDLASSVKDKRYREQKMRLLACQSIYKGYIIEGTCPNPTRKFQSLQPGALESIKIGITCRDNLILMQSSSSLHTAIILQKMLKKLPEYKDIEKDDDEIIVQNAVSGVKKENLTHDRCYLAQLCQLPNVSYNTAVAIKCKYSSMSKLILSINDNRASTIDVISDLKVSDRRIGKSYAEKICNFLIPLPKKVIIKRKHKV